MKITGNKSLSFGRILLACVCMLSLLVPSALAAEIPSADPSRVLIVYYSRTGNTDSIADLIYETTGGTRVELETVDAYPDDYDATVDQVRGEMENGYLPPITTQPLDMSAYDVVFIGSPIWFRDIARPVATFLSQNDLSGKTVVPFFTHGGSGQGSSIETMQQMAPGATFQEAFEVQGDGEETVASDVGTWLARVNAPGANGQIASASTLENPTNIYVNDTVITASLDDSQMSQEFLATLPQTIPLSRLMDREYYGSMAGNFSVTGDQQTNYEEGDVGYWIRGNGLALFFNEGDPLSTPMIKMGKMTSGYEMLESLGSAVEVRIERAI